MDLGCKDGRNGEGVRDADLWKMYRFREQIVYWRGNMYPIFIAVFYRLILDEIIKCHVAFNDPRRCQKMNLECVTAWQKIIPYCISIMCQPYATNCICGS